MNRSFTILSLILTLALVQIACFLPGAASPGSEVKNTNTPMIVVVGTANTTPRPVFTATPGPTASPTDTRPAPTATATPNTWNAFHANEPCTYKVSFIGDVSIPDDTVVEAGSVFVKTWMVRNDGTCTWGPDGYALHALAFTGGSQMGAPSVIPLHTTVQPGQTVDVSVTMTAPTGYGTYTSNWMFRVDNDPNGVGPNLGLGPNGDQPLFARIQVNSRLTRLEFEPGTTTTIVTGNLATNETIGYLVSARQDQVIIAATDLGPWQLGVRVKITTGDNVALPDLRDNLSVAASLPVTGDYIVWLTGGSHATSYHLAVTVPIRITFAPGADSASLAGSFHNGREIWYILSASAGQTLSACLDGTNVHMSIAGLEDPQILTQTVPDDPTIAWTGTLPATQNYTIQVAPTALGPAAYTLKVTIQ